MKIEPYTLDALKARVAAQISVFALQAEKTEKDTTPADQIFAVDSVLHAKVDEEVIYLDDLQKKCIAGELLLEFDPAQGNNFAVYMGMAIYLRARECIKP